MAPLGFPTTMLYAFLASPICAICPAQLILLYSVALIIFYEQYKSLCHESNADLCSDVTAGTFRRKAISILGKNASIFW